MSEIADFINVQYDRIEEAARKASERSATWRVNGTWHLEGAEHNIVGDEEAFCHPHNVEHIALHDPAYVLADIKAKRRILDEVMSWKHDYVDGDTWFSCGLAESPDFPDEGPGSGCADDSKHGKCDCGLEYRQRLILAPLAAPFSAEPGYDAERWTV
jgi:hypothetical protein